MKQTIYILSDSLGETAEYVCRAAACQFACPDMEYKRIPYVNDTSYLFEVLDGIDPAKQAKEPGTPWRPRFLCL